MRSLQIALLLLVALTLPGCEAIASIFRAGMWVGVIGVLLVVVLVGFIVSRARRG
jgi:hypothetical protein